ncbi:NAD-dependent epimerase/dehydratase family protein [Bauldia sp.]|uniref:NAD-dependent epimerase/dehydratase family protein n=1 Tax=Bauldia sp. TaxID=2575872 RepID=UPI003BA88309
MLLLVTGATGKVGRTLIDRILADPALAHINIRALCHNRVLEERDRLSVVRGSIDDRDAVDAALADVTHVVHLATCKEIPETVMDVTVKGLFWLLEAFRESPTASRFVLIGGDAGVGHFFYPRPEPITEDMPHRAYPGCYALSKVLEEVMIEQYGIQYDLNWCCLRAPWIMEKDDFRYTLSFGDDLFGGPDWKTMVPADIAERARETGAVPLLRDADGDPIKRNFVHVDDLIAAIVAALDHPGARRQTFNVCMDEPVDYAAVAAYLNRTRGLGSVDVVSDYHSTWLDNSKAKYVLGWRPAYDLDRLIEAAWTYQRAPDDPRKVWYPG